MILRACTVLEIEGCASPRWYEERFVICKDSGVNAEEHYTEERTAFNLLKNGRPSPETEADFSSSPATSGRWNLRGSEW